MTGGWDPGKEPIMAITEKTTFILNNEYKEQVDLLSDAQAGQLFRAILQYANEQKVDAIADSVVNVMFSFIRQQMDKDCKKYEEACKKRAEAGRKGGLQKAKNKAVAIANVEEADVATASNANFFVANVADSECEYDCDSECDINNKTGHRRHQEEDCAGTQEEEVVDSYADKTVQPYGKATLPILTRQQERYQALANGIMRKYMNRSAKAFDVQKVIQYSSRLAFTAEEVCYAEFDIGRAELLEYAFERAAEQEHMTWKYIDGIMENYNIRGVTTVREAIKNEADWHLGKISV